MDRLYPPQAPKKLKVGHQCRAPAATCTDLPPGSRAHSAFLSPHAVRRGGRASISSPYQQGRVNTGPWQTGPKEIGLRGLRIRSAETTVQIELTSQGLSVDSGVGHAPTLLHLDPPVGHGAWAHVALDIMLVNFLHAKLPFSSPPNVTTLLPKP
jgi:hypothetical protein